MGGAEPTSTVEKAVVHRFMGASTSASSFFDCIRHAASQHTHTAHQAFIIDASLNIMEINPLVDITALAAVTRLPTRPCAAVTCGGRR